MSFLLRLLSILGIVVSFAALLAFELVVHWPADVRKNNVALWLYTPHVAPGDELLVGVEVWGGKKAGIERVTVSAPWERKSIEAPGKNWGSVIVSGNAAARDEEEIALPIPADTKLGDSALLVDVQYVMAQGSGSSFSNEPKTEHVSLPIAIRSARDRTLGRVMSGAFALGVCLAGVLAFRALWPKLVALATMPGVFRAPRTQEEAETERWTMASFGLVFPTLIGWVLAGWLLVAMPLGAAFSRHSTWLTVLAQIAWLAGAPLLGRFLAKRARERALTR